MRTALTHCCRHCEWLQAMVPHDGDSTASITALGAARWSFLNVEQPA